MNKWNKSDIGKVILYRKPGALNENEEVVIYDVNKEIPHTIEVINYPISLDSKFLPLGLFKDQQKPNKFGFKNSGDWCFLKNVSEEEKVVLDNFISAERQLSDNR